MGEDAMAVELAALDEGEGARAAERSGGVGRAAPDGFKLDMVHAGEEEFRPLIFECARVLARAFLAQPYGSDFAEFLRKRRKAAAKFGVRPISRWWSVTAAALAMRKLLRRLKAFANSGSAASGDTSRSASRGA
jgi:hypothetical protein